MLTYFSLCPSVLFLTCTLLGLLPDSARAQAPAIFLVWKPNQERDLSHYLVYRDTVAGTLHYHDWVPRSRASYADREVVPGGLYYYKIVAVDSARNHSAPSVEIVASADTLSRSANFRLDHGFPNPFNSSAFISYFLPRASRVKLAIYDLLGEQIRILEDEERESGAYQILWDGKNDVGQPVSSGTYFFQMKAEGFTGTRRIILVK